LDKEYRTRFRSHFGSHEDMKFELQTFRINNTTGHPSIIKNETLHLEWHKEWLKICRMQVAYSEMDAKSSEAIIIAPCCFDVLFRRGKNTQEHTGNLQMAHLVKMRRDDYDKATKFQKAIVHEGYGRFLKWQQRKG
jgi:hypothetical protein